MTNAPKASRKSDRVRGAAIALVLALTAALAPLTAWAGSDVAARFIWFDPPRTLPEVRFQDEQGQEVALSDLRGRVLLLNIWATWCGPCREEMPTLDRLEAQLGGADFAVVPLSVDEGGIAPVKDFFSEIGIEHLPVYVDDTFKTVRALRLQGIPTTLLLDREGREVGRFVGPADWGAPEAVKFLRDYLERQR